LKKDYEKELRGYPPYHPRMVLKVLAYGTQLDMKRRIEDDKSLINKIVATRNYLTHYDKTPERTATDSELFCLPKYGN
jgi:anti-sigma-K factor RskA